MLRRRGYIQRPTLENATITGVSPNSAVTVNGNITLTGSGTKFVQAYTPNPIILLGGQASSKLLSVRNYLSAEKAYFNTTGDLGFVDHTDTSGTPGDATANTPAGRSAVANTGTTCVVTNSLVGANTKVFICPRGSGGANLRTPQVTSAAGSFTVTINAAASGAWTFDWFVVQVG